jgi:hypothetical protein
MSTRGRLNKEPYTNWSRSNTNFNGIVYNNRINTNQYRNPNANITEQSNRNNFNNVLNSSSYNQGIFKGGYQYRIPNANTQRKINELFVYFKYLCVVRAFQANPNLVNSPDIFIQKCLQIRSNATYNIPQIMGMLTEPNKPTQSQLTPSGVLNAPFSQQSTGSVSWGGNGNTATSRRR